MTDAFESEHYFDWMSAVCEYKIFGIENISKTILTNRFLYISADSYQSPQHIEICSQ